MTDHLGDVETVEPQAMPEDEFRDSLRQLLVRSLGVDDRGDSLVAQIAGDVGLRIIEGELLPGDEVNSVDLAKQFGTSRTPVREALLMLEKHRMVEVPARRRPRVNCRTPAPAACPAAVPGRCSTTTHSGSRQVGPATGSSTSPRSPA